MRSRPFKAKFPGQCASEACRLGGIAEGDVVVYTEDDDLVHEACDTEDPMNTQPMLDGGSRSGAPCGICHLYHSGECF